MKRTLLRFASALAVGIALGCASENLVQDRGVGGSEQEIAVRKVAVVAFQAAPRAGAGPLREDAAALVGSYVADAFSARGFDTVPPSDVVQALGDAATGVGAVRQAADHFGADVVAIGTVYRFRDRSGQAMGSTHAASVGFEVRLFTADGKPVAAKVFDHTQVALTENALVARQYPGGGTRWLTVEELARWAATRVVGAFRLTPR